MSFDQIILAVGLLAVAGILGWGVLTMARGGAYNVKNSNRIMRYRIIFQAAALLDHPGFNLGTAERILDPPPDSIAGMYLMLALSSQQFFGTIKQWSN